MNDTLRDVLQRVDRDDVMAALVRLELADDDELSVYERVMDRLQSIEPDYTTTLTSIIISGDGDVSGIEREYDCKLAIEFTPWDQWLMAILIRGEGAGAFTDEELVAYVLWEMTFISADPDEIAARHMELVASIDALKLKHGLNEQDPDPSQETQP